MCTPRATIKLVTANSPENKAWALASSTCLIQRSTKIWGSSRPRREKMFPFRFSASLSQMARKSSAAGQGGRSRGDNSTLDSIGAYSGPSLSFPLTFVLTPIEAHHIQKALSKVGLAKKPQCEISTTNPPTPTPSYPSTPVSGLAPKNSPFQSLSSINDSLDQSTSQQNVKPSLSLALQNAFNDDVLPLASRSALRAFLLGWFVNYTMDTLVPTVMQRKT